MPATRILAAAGVLVAVVAGAAVLATGGGREYQVKLVVPSAAQLVDEAPVWIDGESVGRVESAEVREGKAIVTVSVDDAHAPLHAGTTSRIEWVSVLGERVVTLYPGPGENPEIPDGSLLDAPSAQIEVDTVLAAFDAPTREKLNSLIANLNGTVEGREDQFEETFRNLGPTVSALGQVLQAVGRDGQAIQDLVTELHQVTGPLAARQDQVRSVVNDLTMLTAQVAPQQAGIRDGLKEVPSTLDTARATLDMIPAATDASVPLLEDLQPGVAKLPAVSRELAPLLRDLRPTVGDLKPTLDSLSDVLDRFPSFADSSGGFLPKAREAAEIYQPALSFLRPYTPEIVGFATNWGNAFSGYDSEGHVWAGAPAVTGESSVDDTPGGGVPTGIITDPAPGALVDQPWTDANGNGMR